MNNSQAALSAEPQVDTLASNAPRRRGRPKGSPSVRREKLDDPADAARAVPIKNFAKRASISESTVYKLMRLQKLQTIHVLGRTLIPLTELDRLLAGEMA